MNKYPCVVTIAGSDPSGGAGIQADIKTISALGCYAASVITALTAQNTIGVQAVFEIPADFVEQQLDSVFTDLKINAVKIGMLHNKAVIDKVRSALQKYKPSFVVLDPVMISKSGHALLQADTIQYLTQTLLPLVTLITPNIPEAESLLNCKINSKQTMESAAFELAQQIKTNVLIKGGHLQDAHAADVLYLLNEQSWQWYDTKRIDTKNTHGTGCTLSSAIASYLALGNPLNESVKLAKEYLTQAIQAGSFLNIGHGHGPVKHFFK